MDRTHSLHCPKSENNLGFKVADGPYHSLHFPENENHLHIFFIRNQPIRNLLQQILNSKKLTSSDILHF